jgi:CRP-like cAMP-binding protein
MAQKVKKAEISEISLSEKFLHQIACSLGYLVLQTADLKDKKDNDRIPILASLGFDRAFIAEMLQTTPERVSVRLSQLKGKSEGKQKK